MRFLRGFIAGFVATALTVIAPNITTIPQLGNWLYALLVAGIVGGITGGLLAIDKWFRDSSTSSNQVIK